MVIFFIVGSGVGVIRICAIRSAYERIRSEAYFARLIKTLSYNNGAM